MTVAAYYNDNDPRACAWLRELIADGLITPGEVDSRPIQEVEPADLRGFARVHFFAGIGGWDLALNMAGWGDRPVWTGSCPCQPFSAAGKRKGTDDERHLWPAFFRLIAECRPAAVFGEQVASRDGCEWLAGVRADLEGAGYAVGAADLCAAGVGSPHIRQRLYWVADASGGRRSWAGAESCAEDGDGAGPSKYCRDGDGLGDAQRNGWRPDKPLERAEARTASRWPVSCGDGLGDTIGPRLEGHGGHGSERREPGRIGSTAARSVAPPGWNDCGLVRCVEPTRDGGTREVYRRAPIEPFFQFTSDGLSNIMGDRWVSFVHAVQNVVGFYATKEAARPGKVLRTLWQAVAAQAIRRSAGGYGEVSEPEILLLALCELARSSWAQFQDAAQDFCQIERATLRVLWSNAREPTPPACSPHQWKLDGPSSGESSDAVRWVPFKAAHEAVSAMLGMRGEIPQGRYVPEALSALEEIWRSVADEGSGRVAKRIRAGASLVSGLSRYPLAESLPGRVGLLRGAGNAIVPEVAAKFVSAFLSTSPGV